MPAPAPDPHHPSQAKKMRFSLVIALTALASTAFASHEICVLVESKGDFSRFTVALHAKGDAYLIHQTGEHSKFAKSYTFRNDLGWVDIKKDLTLFTAVFDGGAWSSSYFQQEKWLKKDQCRVVPYDQSTLGIIGRPLARSVDPWHGQLTLGRS
ncbi:hypothetical protein BGX30_005892 [Mortierella sp. GBA39]|nr:hypothetical protein BGX30_005892 [Mortierella sp. GBA39]